MRNGMSSTLTETTSTHDDPALVRLALRLTVHRTERDDGERVERHLCPACQTACGVEKVGSRPAPSIGDRLVAILEEIG